MDGPAKGVQKHAVLWTAMPGHDELRTLAPTKIAVLPAFDEIEFPNSGTFRFEITIAGHRPSVIVLRTSVSKNETSSSGSSAQTTNRRS
jgi:hypothetical protein